MSKLKPQSTDVVGFMSTISPREVLPFEQVADIKDKKAFAKQLERLLSERCKRLMSYQIAELKSQAQRLEMGAPWVANATEMQRGREVLNMDFDVGSNLPVPAFSRLAQKSKAQIYEDISKRRLLALDINKRGKRLPDWQLDKNALELTQRVLAKAKELDNWSIFRELSDPTGRFSGKSPVDAAKSGASVEDVAAFVLRALGVNLGQEYASVSKSRQATE